jgi:calcineurin-like phosphoesterase family protein
MGWRFELKHANTVAYITVPTQQKPPRLTGWQLREFLRSLQGKYRECPPLFSADDGWVYEITRIASRASDWLESRNLDIDSLLSPGVITHALADLRLALGRYDVYGLAVGSWDDADPLHAFAEHAAYSSGRHGLFLIPDLPSSDDTLEIFDPSPVAKRITARPDLWPGMLFWVKTGEAAFASLGAAQGLYQRLLEVMRRDRDSSASAGRVLKEFNAQDDDSGVKRLLHLSDLHFGTSQALQNQAYLSSHLKTKLKTFQRVVFTGDLFDNPKEKDALAFRNFRADIEASMGKELIVIPGNHDQKIYGNTFFGFGRKLRELTKLEWSSLVVDDELQFVLYCFDTSRDARLFARGNITREQMIEVATLFETKLVTKPALKNYLSVALVHHHPYSFDTRTETPLQKGLQAIGLSDESFLKMEGADEFLSWCVGRRVPLVLHGHKHVSRHVKDRIEWTHGKESDWREVTAVGCGTSLGAEGMPLSYNVLEWSPTSQKWSAAFFSDPGFGTGFEETYVALHSASA